jgi:hypothetical protein
VRKKKGKKVHVLFRGLHSSMCLVEGDCRQSGDSELPGLVNNRFECFAECFSECANQSNNDMLQTVYDVVKFSSNN